MRGNSPVHCGMRHPAATRDSQRRLDTCPERAKLRAKYRLPGGAFMSKIFISYRRHDSRPVATLIYDPLARHFEAKFGAGAVFMDVHGIPLGVNFRSYLNEQVAGAELLLALIADRWLTAVDERGSRRLDSPNDFVRIEIEAALQRGIPVVPVYVDDANFLSEADLPGSLKDLAWMNGFQLRTDARYFAADAARLIAGLEPHLRASQPVADVKTRAEKYVESGVEHYSKGNYDRAIAEYDEAIRLYPKHATAYNNRALAYFSIGDYDRAIADCNEAIRLDPKLANAYYNRGAAYYGKGDDDRAIPEYDEAIRLNPKYACAYSSRGAVFYNKGDYNRAIADCDEAVRLDPKDPTAYNNRGLAYYSKGNYDRAIADYDRALAIDPTHQHAVRNKRIAEEKRTGQGKKKGWFG